MPPEIGALALLISNLLHLRTLNCMLQTHRPRTSCRRSNVDLHFTNPPSNTKPPPPKLNYKPPLNYETPLPDVYFGYFLFCVACFVAEREKLQLLRPLQLCRERERNCSYYDRSSCAECEKLQLLRPLHCAEREKTATTTTLSAVQRERERERETAATIVLRRPKPPSIVNPPCPGPAINRGGGGFIIRRS